MFNSTYLNGFPGPLGIRNLVVGVIARNKILHNGAGLEQANTLAITESVGQGGDAAIGVDGKEPRLLLYVL